MTCSERSFGAPKHWHAIARPGWGRSGINTPLGDFRASVRNPTPPGQHIRSVGVVRFQDFLAALHLRTTFHMRMNKNARLNKQRHAELLRRRIEELDQHLAFLNSERGRFARLLDGVRE